MRHNSADEEEQKRSFREFAFIAATSLRRTSLPNGSDRNRIRIRHHGRHRRDDSRDNYHR